MYSNDALFCLVDDISKGRHVDIIGAIQQVRFVKEITPVLMEGVHGESVQEVG